MDGWTYERKCADFLRNIGFEDVNVTRGSNDDGVDIVAIYEGYKYAVQCKYYEGKVGKKAISEVFAGSKSSKYNAEKCLVITNAIFTQPAIDYADDLGVELLKSIDAIVMGDIDLSFKAIKEWQLKYNHSSEKNKKANCASKRDAIDIPILIDSFIEWKNEMMNEIKNKKYEYYDSIDDECLKDFAKIKRQVFQYEKYYDIGQSDYTKINYMLKYLIEKISVPCPNELEYIKYIEKKEYKENNPVKKTKIKEIYKDRVRYTQRRNNIPSSNISLEKWLDTFDYIRMRYNNESNSDYDILQEFEAIKEKMIVYKNEYIMSKDDLLAIRKIVLFLHGRLSVRAYEMIEYGRFLKMLAETAPEGKSIKISN